MKHQVALFNAFLCLHVHVRDGHTKANGSLLATHFIRHRKPFILISQTQVYSFQELFCDD